MAKNEQPAKVSIFFGPGWKMLKEWIGVFWKENRSIVQDYYYSYQQKGLMTFLGIFWLLCAFSVAVFGTLFFAVITVGISAVLAMFFVLVYIGFSLLWLVDRIYLKRNKIFTACPSCKARSLIPVYACPNCGARHTNLTPGKYGILYRTCSCGQKLGTCFLTGRKNYPAYCASCGEPIYDQESKPVCIPIVGGRSVGKTAFITAFSREFIEQTAPSKGWETVPYNTDKKQIYREILADYSSGSTRMTDRPQDINQTSAVSFSFFVKGDDLKPERLMHIYDIAGEVFTDNTENEIQKQYEYCQGIVLMIDPFSIPAVCNRYESGLQPEDIAGIGRADIGGIVDAFINKLREVTGLSVGKMSSTPLAVVLSKADAPGLRDEVGKQAVKEALHEMTERGIEATEMDAQDYVCRSFLKRYGMESLLNAIDIKFKNNRYFVCSAIGHTRDKGRYRPEGVMEPMEWLIGNADAAMAKKFNTHKFGKVPVKMEAGK